MDEKITEAITEEKNRCIAWVEYARSEGESDMRQVRNWINSGEWPSGSAPVRLCCGQRHWGAVCPDGKVMCCICFERVSQDNLNVLANGKKEDVCKSCAQKEQNA